MKRVLMLASVASMIDQFNLSNIKLLQGMGYEVDVACNFINGSTCSDEKIEELKKKLYAINVDDIQIDFTRDVLDLKKDYVAYKQVLELMNAKQYEFVHCHSPIGGVIGRLACHRKGVKAVYTAHGFHFYKGAPLINWLIYYPIEKICSCWTDILITINREDYTFAKRKMKARRIEYIPGIGVDIRKFASNRKFKRDNKFRRDLNVPEDSLLLVSVGELNKNKNHEVIIRAMAQLQDRNIHYVIAGKGELYDYLLNLAKKLNVAEQIHLLGFCENIPELYENADVCVFPSIREGLGLAAIEGMASGLPLLVADNRGTRDYAIHLKNAFVCPRSDIMKFAEAIRTLKQDVDIREQMGRENEKLACKYDVKNINRHMLEIYKTIL